MKFLKRFRITDKKNLKPGKKYPAPSKEVKIDPFDIAAQAMRAKQRGPSKRRRDVLDRFLMRMEIVFMPETIN